jgi:uncharacterized protein (TIGR03435 family)
MITRHFSASNSFAIRLALAICCFSLYASGQSSGPKLLSVTEVPTIKVTPNRSGDSFTRIALRETGFADVVGPVVDHTGLTGNYDVSLSWDKSLTTVDASLRYAVLDSAVRAQLGLALVPEQQNIDRFVVDNIAIPGNYSS